MKALGRILIILTAFVLVMGITYVIVNVTSSSNTPAAFERREEAFPRPEGVESPFPRGERPDFDRDGPRGGGWIFGSIKNVGILTVIVALIIIPKSLLRKRTATVSTK